MSTYILHVEYIYSIADVVGFVSQSTWNNKNNKKTLCKKKIKVELIRVIFLGSLDEK